MLACKRKIIDPHEPAPLFESLFEKLERNAKSCFLLPGVREVVHWPHNALEIAIVLEELVLLEFLIEEKDQFSVCNSSFEPTKRMLQHGSSRRQPVSVTKRPPYLSLLCDMRLTYAWSFVIFHKFRQMTGLRKLTVVGSKLGASYRSPSGILLHDIFGYRSDDRRYPRHRTVCSSQCVAVRAGRRRLSL